MIENHNIPHVPVMLPEVIQYLAPKDGEVYVDCTFGAGGYSKAILDEADCTVIAIDTDPDVIKLAKELEIKINRQKNKKFIFIQGNFAEVESIVKKLGYEFVDGIVVDLGVSSMQLDSVGRGFSFNSEALLDMRMSQDGVSAYDIVNKYSEKDLADIIFQFGDEKKSRQIAKRIVQQRNISPIGTTIQLANIVRSVVRNGSKIDPATKTFQAIRICVNDELKNLQRVLIASEVLLKNKSRLVVVSFHSLEDKIVKNYLNEKSGKVEGVSRYIPSDIDNKPIGVFKILTKKAVLCSENERNNNIRARSARLRAAICNRDK